MRLAYFHTNTILSSWTNLSIAQTLRRMGHEVLEGAIPTNDHGAVIFQCTPREYQATVAKMPTINDLRTCDVILVTAPEYYLAWLNSLYGKEIWRALEVPRVALYVETSQRDDHDFRYQDVQEWFSIHFYPSLEDTERYQGHYLPPSVDTQMFKPCPDSGGDGHQCDDSCRTRTLHEKKFDAAFVGSLYQKRMEYLQKLLPYMQDIDFRAGGVAVRDLGGERQREWAELLAANLRQIKVHVALPSNNSRMMVARPLETMACGTFVLTYRTPDNLFRDGVHCRFYDPENPEELARLIRYYLEHEVEREAIASSGCEEVQKNFSLEKRLSEILAVVEGHVSRSLDATPISAALKAAKIVGEAVAKLVEAGDLTAALTLLDDAISKGETADLWNDWATVQSANGNVKLAEHGYRNALRKDGAHRQAGVNLGLLLFSLSRLEGALPLLEQHKSSLTQEEKQALLKLVERFKNSGPNANVKRCRMCGNEEGRIERESAYAAFFQLRVKPADPTLVAWCPRCCSTLPEHEFSDAELAPLYADYRQQSYNRERLEVEPGFAPYVNLGTDPEIRAERDRLTSGFLGRNLKEVFTALDYGGSDGWTTPSWVIENCYEVDVFDVSNVPLVDSRLHKANGLGGWYELILCQHVMEHVGNPLGLAKRLMSYTKLLYIEVPLEGALEPPPFSTLHEHINSFSSKSVPKLAEALGARVVGSEILYFSLGFPALIGRYLLKMD